MSPWIPRIEFDGYELRQLIGKGGYGEVHLAQDTLLDREVAIKFVSASAADETARKRFVIEARAIARLQHPNVVTIYRVGEVDGCPYLVSEFVKGQDLNSIPRPVSSDMALKIAIDVARGLAAAHSRGVVHRDIKPANAILSESGSVKLLDFGIAKLTQPAASEEAANAVADAPAVQRDRLSAAAAAAALADKRGMGLTRVGDLMGTPAYIAPELWNYQPATFRSDVYSFGALLYTLCAGAPPHTGTNVLVIAEKATSQDARPLAEAAPGIEPELCAVVDRCLRRRPDERYASANEVRARLEQLTSSRRDGAVPEGNPYRGLHAFEAEHQNLFFGRDSEIRILLERLTVDPFVLVAGDSGLGKSSLCRAGVLPRVGKSLEQARRWSSVTLVPSKHPVTSLSVALANLLGADEAELRRQIVDDPGEVARTLRAWSGKNRGVVIFIDQLEELVTFSDAEECGAVAEVLGWFAEPAPGVRLLATARGDFLGRLALLPRLGEMLSRALFFLRPLSAERIREAVAGPAEAKGVAFESESLVEELVTSAMQAEGGLPLLQFTLAELWDALGPKKEGISRSALESIGGVAGSLSRHAENVLLPMSPEERAAAKNVLLRLVTADRTSARRTDAELRDGNPATAAALAALVRGRLVVVRDKAEGATYEIAHEALISSWSTMSGWLSSDAESQRVRERLRAAVAEWDRLGRSREALWSPRQLQEAGVVGVETLSGPERAFLDASRRAERRRRLNRFGMLSSLPLVVLLIYGGVSLRNYFELERRVRGTLKAASGELAEGRGMRQKAAELRQRALGLFDSQQLKAAEPLWSKYLAALAESQLHYGQASRELETAVLLAPERAELQGGFADVLFERALLAEELRQRGQQNELLQRLALYDPGGARARKWHAPATVSLEVTPAGASVVVHRYRQMDNQAVVLEAVELPIPRLRELQLPAGSYLAQVSAPGYARVRYPFTLERGERTRLELKLPRSAQVPPGYVYVPPGRFLFGSAAEDNVRRDFFHTVPIHPVTTGGYLIAVHETTFSDWIEYLNALPVSKRTASAPRVEKGGFVGALAMQETRDGVWQITFQPGSRKLVARSDERIHYPGRRTRADQDWRRFPVFGISVADAREYLAWLDRSGKIPGARFCTELEWERGARGADGREFPHGDALSRDEANFDDTYAMDPQAMGPDEVGSHQASASPFGLHDMAGNVWEITQSSLAKDQFPARGGGWDFGANSSRSTDREAIALSFRAVDVGLRVCADLPSR